MIVVEAVAKILKKEGIEFVTCFPSNDLLEAVAQEDIRTIMFRHERGAVMAADGFSRMKGRNNFGVVITQGTSGAENAMGGIAQAFADNVPILYLTDGPLLSQYGVNPYFSPVRTYESVSRHAELISHPDQVSDVMRRAFHALRNGTPGPVIVEIPKDVGESNMPSDDIEYSIPTRTLQLPEQDKINKAVKILLEAKRPVIWSGMGVLFSRATVQLQELAELLQIPVFCTMPGKSSFNENHPLSLGSGSAATTLPAKKWLKDSDVLFAIGSSLTKTLYGQQIPAGKKIIHSVESISNINKDFPAEVGLPGDAKLILEAILKEVKTQLKVNNDINTGISDEIALLKEKWMSEWQPILESDETPINTYRVIHAMNLAIDKDNSTITHDAGAPRDTIMPFYIATVPHSYVGWGKSTHLGYGIPLMIGAKIANPNRFCMNFMGDGAFGMSGLDIETSVREKIPITTLVLNNGGMATYPGGYPAAKEKFGTTFLTGDYAKIAEGLGAIGIVVKDPNELIPAIKKAQELNASGKTVLIDVHSNLEGRRSFPEV
ncbi:MAG: hypothetical protein CL766_05775 [Chloroflexi bacterium]|nr:hypothetical protein [Chloroflexota bacterium]|tara:strand:- start:6892 stop:8532 length:1641 start_codon:yes stop_codon:yes gene_type:complete